VSPQPRQSTLPGHCPMPPSPPPPPPPLSPHCQPESPVYARLELPPYPMSPPPSPGDAVFVSPSASPIILTMGPQQLKVATAVLHKLHHSECCSTVVPPHPHPTPTPTHTPHPTVHMCMWHARRIGSGGYCEYVPVLSPIPSCPPSPPPRGFFARLPLPLPAPCPLLPLPAPCPPPLPNRRHHQPVPAGPSAVPVHAV
jgi:hypothetical protein